MSTIDIVKAATQHDPSGFADAVRNELNDRIASAIEDKRKEVASRIFDLYDDEQEEDE